MAEDRQDSLLHSVGEMARQKLTAEDASRFDSRWDDYAAGRLDSREIAELTAEDPGTDDSELQLAEELFRPMEKSRKASWVEQIEQELAKSGSGDVVPVTESASASDSLESAEEASLKNESKGILHRLGEVVADWLGTSPRSAERWVLAAAALFLAVIWIGPIFASLPGYGIEILELSTSRSYSSSDHQDSSFKEGETGFGGSEGSSFEIRQGATLEILLRPDTRVAGPLSVQIFVQKGNEDPKRWAEAEQRAAFQASGAVKIQNVDWILDSGNWTVGALITRSTLDQEAAEDLFTELLESGSASIDRGVTRRLGRPISWTLVRLDVQP